MNFNNFNKRPTKKDYDYCDSLGHITESDFSYLTIDTSMITDVWYWYVEGYYEGNGAMILKDLSGNFHTHDCGHCSCYGPVERLALNAPYSSLDAIKGSMTEDCYDDYEDLIEWIKAQ